jgi:transcriptional regulator with XRE-family HTH domain
MYYEKIREFFREKGLKQREVAEIMGYSETMIGRYFKGTNKVDAVFITLLVEKFPEIDLKYIFTVTKENNLDVLNEPTQVYEKATILTDIGEIEMKLKILKEKLIQQGLDK